MALVWIVSGMPAQQLFRPSLKVPACPTTGSLSYNASVPDSGLFPLTQVDLCYDDSSIHVKFTAYEEKDFYCNAHLITRPAGLHLPPGVWGHANSRIADNQSLTTNGEIYNYEVMEAFIVRTLGQNTVDPPCINSYSRSATVPCGQ